MPRWTTSHHVQLSNLEQLPCNFRTSILDNVVRIGKDIWILNHVHYQMTRVFNLEVIVFDTVSRKISQIVIDRPEGMDVKIEAVTSSEDSLYMWWGYGTHTLCKLDTKTMKWDKILTIECGVISDDTPVINDTMFVLDVDRNSGMVHLITIDLVAKMVMRRLRLNIDENFQQLNLLVLNEQLYLLMCVENSRVVFKVENGAEKEVSRDFYDKSELTIVSQWFNGHLLLLSTKTRQLYIDTFNFSTAQWIKTEIENCWKDTFPYRLKTAIEMDGVVYGMMEYKDFKEQKAEIRVFDFAPKLADLCLLDLVDKVIATDKKDIEDIRGKLTASEKERFDNMISWKSSEINRALITKLYNELSEDMKKSGLEDMNDELKARYDAIQEIEY